jgi:hypothetical protein
VPYGVIGLKRDGCRGEESGPKGGPRTTPARPDAHLNT